MPDPNSSQAFPWRIFLVLERLEILKNDSSFVGYIESETLYGKFSTNFEERREFDSRLHFPLPIMKTVRVPHSSHKMADLHVKKEGDAEKDDLDRILSCHGFYEVNTPRHRIYTLQTQHISDAKKIYYILRQYFYQAGGIKQLNFEMVGKLKKFPCNCEVSSKRVYGLGIGRSK